MIASAAKEIDALLERSHRLGADRRVTNYGGGNTSCKMDGVDPVTGEAVPLLVVKGSGGDLGALTRDGLAVLRADRVRGIARVHHGPGDDDAAAELLGHCGFGPAGAAPSIDTAMHALVLAPHVDHLHPDAVIALATATEGEELVKECFGREVAWLPWQRPGFELGLAVSALHRDNPGLRGVVLGGHGLTTWGDTSAECEATSLEVIRRAERFIVERGKSHPFGAQRDGFGPLPPRERRQLASQLAPFLRGMCSTDHRVVGHYSTDPVVLDFLAHEAATRLAPKGTSCPDHFIRTKVRPLLLDMAPTAPLEDLVDRLRELHAAYRHDYRTYYEQHATAGSPAMRGADPAVVLVPGVGMFTFGVDAKAARLAAEFYLNAINVMRGAEALSTYEPIPESEKFRIEYWELEEAKLRRLPPPKRLTGRVAFVTGGASGIGRAVVERLAAEGAAVVVADLDAARARGVALELGGPDIAESVAVDVSDEQAVTAAISEACATYGGVDIIVNNAGLSHSKPLIETSVAEWDDQHNVMARGSFLVSREAAKVLAAQGLEGDIVYVVSKNSVVAGPDNVAYGAAKADQAHQVRLLAAELGPKGVRVNGVNPDGVVRGSGIFAGAWGEQRAKVYGVEPEELGRYYASRTVLGREVLPEHVAGAVLALVGGDLDRTTGTIVPVDSGVPMAFLR